MYKVKDLTGQKFGRLTVIERDTSAKKGRSKWICKCDCGKTISVYKNHLTSGHTSSCGCAKAGVNLKDITGQRFGRLVALERTDQKSGNVYIYKCHCDCGKICYVSGAHLRSGDTVSCGCYASDIHQKSFSTAKKERKKSYVYGTDIAQISNMRTPRNNTSGYRGVNWDNSVKTWKAYIVFQGKRYYLGSSRDIEVAISYRKAAEKEIYRNFLEWYYRNLKK